MLLSIKNKFALFAVLLFTSSLSFAQEAPAYRRNAVHVEVGGTGVRGSISYERLKRFKNGSYFAPSIGVALPFPEHSAQITSEFFMIPLQFNWLLGPKTSKIEVGFSVNPAYSTYVYTETGKMGRSFGALPSWRIGYRYMGSNGLVIRAGFTPVIFINPWAGVSLGYSF